MKVLNIPLRIAGLALSLVNRMLGGALDPIIDNSSDKAKSGLSSLRI